MSNGNSVAKWIAIITSIFIAIAGGAYAYTTILNKQIDHRVERLEEKFERIMECNIEIKQDVKWIKWHLEVDSE